MNRNQIKHRTRNIGQWFKNLKVGVIGGYHGGNLGDIALGESVLEILNENGIQSGLQTIYNLEKWPFTPYAIVGGGAIGYIDSLKRIIKRYKKDYSKIALVGIDFNEDIYPEDCLHLFQESAFISCRSQKQSLKLKELIERDDVLYHPDLSFSFKSKFCGEIRNRTNKDSVKKLLINIVPLYGNLHNGQVSPHDQFKTERPELFENFETMHISYKKFIENAIEYAICEGYEVESIPFTEADERFSKIIMGDLPVKLNKYNPDPYQMLTHMATADWIISTRFHATVFAMKLGIKFTPIAYAIKNETLLLEAGFKRTEFLSVEDLANGDYSFLSPMKVKNDLVAKWEELCSDAILKSLHTLKLI